MSRIGRLPIVLPAGVTAKIEDGNVVTVKGPKGELTQKFNTDMKIEMEGTEITITRPSDRKEHRALHGLTRALFNNMVVGVSEGFKKELEIIGVGYRAQLTGKDITLNVGYSHPVVINPPAGITFEVPNPNAIVITGIDKQTVGQIAANIREVRPPEPYKGKGIKYKEETIRRKEGKSGM